MAPTRATTALALPLTAASGSPILGPDSEGVDRMSMPKTELRKSQSFTFAETAVALDILRFAMRNNDLKVLVQRPDFITLYRKFSKMREKMAELMNSGNSLSKDGQADQDAAED